MSCFKRWPTISTNNPGKTAVIRIEVLAFLCGALAVIVLASCGEPLIPDSLGVGGSECDGDSVTFPDPDLENAVRRRIDLPSGCIYPSDLEGLEALVMGGRHIPSPNVEDLSGLGHAANLRRLQLPYAAVSDLSPLRNLTELDSVNFDYNRNIADLGPLSASEGLKLLRFNENQISDLSVLGAFRQLEVLHIWGNEISDISPLSRLTELRRLNLARNPISDVSPLMGLTHLKVLWLGSEELSEIPDLSALVELDSLTLGSSQVRDISGLSGLTGLVHLNLIANSVSDLSPQPHLGSFSSGRAQKPGDPSAQPQQAI